MTNNYYKIILYKRDKLQSDVGMEFFDNKIVKNILQKAYKVY